MKFKEKLQSRKYQLVIIIIILATLGTFCPPIFSIFGIKFAILSGTEFVSLITLIIGAYFGANAWQNRAEINASYVEDTHIRTIVQENKSDVTTNQEFENKEEAEV